MAFLGSKACHEECGVRIMDYLERDRDGNPRAIAFDCINLGDPDVARGRWAAMMDATRTLAGNDASWGGRPCVTYQHFVISPDPHDGVTLDELRELATAWAQEFFGTQTEPGRLGSYEVAIVYHDDNDLHIPHAHIIVNNTDLDTGRRLHTDVRQSRQLTDRLQEMCEERGLAFYGEGEGAAAASAEGRYFTREERKILRQGRFSWKQDIANNVVVALRTSRNEDEFIATCERHGIDVDVREGEYVYTHRHNPTRWRVGGYRLGRNYAREHVLSKLSDNEREFGARLAALRENVSRHVLEGLFDDMDLVAVVEHGIRVRDVARALGASERFQIRSEADFGKRIAAARIRLSATRDPELKSALEAQVKELEFARDVANSAGFFEGVDLGPASRGAAPMGGAGRGGAGGQEGSAASQGSPARQPREDRRRGKAADRNAGRRSSKAGRGNASR